MPVNVYFVSEVQTTQPQTVTFGQIFIKFTISLWFGNQIGNGLLRYSVASRGREECIYF
jgi:hypothetical protein